MRCCLLLFISPILLSAQSYSLDSCIHVALDNSIALNTLDLQIEHATQAVKYEQHKFLPTVSASLNNGLALGFQPVYIDEYAGQYESVQTYTNSGRIYLGVALWSANAQLVSVKNKLLLKASTESNKNYQELQIKLDVAKKYYALAIAKARQSVTLYSYNLQDSSLQVSRNLYTIGKKSQMDVLESENNLLQDKQNLQAAINQERINREELILSMQMEDTVSFSILPTQNLPLSISFVKAFDEIRTEHPLLEEQRMKIDAAVYDISYHKRLLYPSIDLNYEMGTSSQLVLNRENTPIVTQWENNFYQNILIGINIPIYSQSNVRTQIRQASINKEILQSELDNMLLDLENQLKLIYLDIKKSQEQFELATQTETSMGKQYELAQKQYALGAIPNYELNMYKNKYVSSQLQKVQYKYELFYNLTILKLLTDI